MHNLKLYMKSYILSLKEDLDVNIILEMKSTVKEKDIK